MKKLLALILALALFMAGCAAGTGTETVPPTTAETEPATTAAPEKVPLTDSLETVIENIYAQHSVEFAVGTMPVDITDTEWSLKAYTGLESNELILEAAASEAMIGAIPYSLVLVRVKDAADAQTVAQQMKAGIDPRKWICVEADDLKAAGYCDVVMLVMVGSNYAESVTAQDMVDAFQAVCGGELDFVLE